MDENNTQDRAPRKKLDRPVEFIIDADVIAAQGLNISETGISFETEEPITIVMRLKDRDKSEYRAELIWAQKNEAGAMSYGLRFLGSEPDYTES
ncbi:PilZ domain-containing protein [Chitinivibrio alkaliphilus]|uniref:PilZ domain-containing protein n=1 Tax=Chitinivibrio alkaliphilus ACht1 TaxID=1313304 RepID=U7D8W4_9BACT|nr:PilZ domain-containing protein [Chitinivibrio alkaliphilus]ERP39385.1 hypothetical protein CALK_0185 [Chitinivibrio alkaliphilus ACht1]